MIPVNEALRRVLEDVPEAKTEFVAFQDALGRITAEPVRADRPFPPFDRVSMDGIAIAYEAYKKGRRSFGIKGVQAAGSPQMELPSTDDCLEVMTGAILPRFADTVIQYEHVDMASGEASPRRSVKKGQNVHKAGLDRKQGDILIPKGKVIGQAEMAVLATVGKVDVEVQKMPFVGIVSTGNELVPVEEIPEPHQIRASNVHAIGSELKKLGIKAETRHIKDKKNDLIKGLTEMIDHFDLILMSGGVSRGKFDFVPEVLEELGIMKRFHKVAQRPGKPFWFGRNNRCTVFGLPGNPISSLVCFMIYVKPWLRKYYRLGDPSRVYVQLQEEVHFAPTLTRFMEVRLDSLPSGVLAAHPVPGKGSGDLANLLEADGFIELPDDRETFNVGEVFPYYGYRKRI
jgi:molybdopterin molybdotransferase